MQLHKWTVLTLAAIAFFAGYLLGQSNLARLTPEADPRRTAQRALTSIRDDVSQSDLTSVQLDNHARRLNQTAEKYGRAIKDLEQFGRRKKRRACLTDAVTTFDQASARGHQIDGCGNDQECVETARANLRDAIEVSKTKLDECLRLFESKNPS